MKVLFALTLLLPGLLIGPAIKMDTYQINNSSSMLKIEGTSTIHDWDMEATSYEGEAVMALNEASDLEIQSMRISLKAENLKSGHDGMDDNAYKALKTKNYPNIVFTLSKVESITKTETHFNVKANGNLTIAGKTRNISLTAVCKPQSNGTFSFEGKTAIKMTDYGVDPPTALLGTIKTGNDLTIIYRAGFTKSNL